MINVQKQYFTSKDVIVASFHNERYRMAHHIHHMTELVYVTSGRLKVIVGGRIEYAAAGDIVIIPGYQPHAYYTAEGETVAMWMLLFSNSIVSDLINDGSLYPGFERSVFRASEPLRIFLESKTFDTGEEPTVLDKMGIRRIKSILYPVIEEYAREVRALPANKAQKSSSVTATLGYLSEHFGENIKLSDVSRSIGFSESHISHSLSSVCGVNFRSLLNYFRLEHAKGLLSTKNISISAVAAESGFSSERSFNRIFLEAVGMTPTEYRKGMR